MLSEVFLQHIAGKVRGQVFQVEAFNVDVGEPLWGRRTRLNDVNVNKS